MPPDDSYRFPEGRKLKRLRGEQMVVGGISLTLDEILSEKSYTIFDEYWAVFRVTTARGNRYILKLRYQFVPEGQILRRLDLDWLMDILRQDPDYLDSEDKFLCQRSANTSFHDELDCLRAMSSSTRTPNLIQSDEVVQGETDFCPGGYLRRIVMSIAPGQSIVDMWDLLTREDRELIRDQLAETLEYLNPKIPRYLCVRNSSLTLNRPEQVFETSRLGFCDEETAQIHFDPVSREM